MNWPANYIEVPQMSAEWLDMRLGVLTSSKIRDAVRKPANAGKTTKKGKPYKAPGELAARRNLIIEMAYEIENRRTSEHYFSEWMERGIEREEFARTAYEFEHDVRVHLMGLIFHPRINNAAASPDGLIGEDGMVEFKCPKENTHWRYLLAGTVPEIYKPQMYWQMACADRKWCDFVSFCPEMRKPAFKLFTVRLHRDEGIIADMEREAEIFLGQLETELKVFRERLEMTCGLPITASR